MPDRLFRAQRHRALQRHCLPRSRDTANSSFRLITQKGRDVSAEIGAFTLALSCQKAHLDFLVFIVLFVSSNTETGCLFPVVHQITALTDFD